MNEYRNLESEMLNAPWFVEKVKQSPEYAQQVYAGLCNNEFCPLDIFSILKNEYWSCTWRNAGGIVSDILEEGDYIDWYCSGSEGHITEEFAKDLEALGWKVVNNENNGDWL